MKIPLVAQRFLRTSSPSTVRAESAKGVRLYQLGRPLSEAQALGENAERAFRECGKLDSQGALSHSLSFPVLGNVRYIDHAPRTSDRHTVLPKTGTRPKFNPHERLTARLRRLAKKRKALAAA